MQESTAQLNETWCYCWKVLIAVCDDTLEIINCVFLIPVIDSFHAADAKSSCVDFRLALFP
jgi:hypothetical protein